MDGNRYIPPMGDAESGDLYSVQEEQSASVIGQEEQSASVIGIEQLQRLVRLIDQSSISELELKHAEEGIRLVLRKAKVPENGESSNGTLASTQFVVPTSDAEAEPAPSEIEHKIVAHLVGTFHVWAKPRGGTLVVVGDRVKVGQLVGTIESLNVFNEVESPVAGRVVEIFVQEGQPVEYGQLLMTIASSTQG